MKTIIIKDKYDNTETRYDYLFGYIAKINGELIMQLNTNYECKNSIIIKIDESVEIIHLL